jgi:uncharacterized membrane protein YesL
MGPLLARIYKKAFWNVYDHIGRVILVNLVWFLVFPLPTFLIFRYVPLAGYARIGAALAAGLLLNAFAMSGVFAYAARIADYQPASLGDFLAGGRRFYLRMLALSLIFAAAFFLLATSIQFYIRLEVGGGILGFFLAGIQAWIGAFLLLMQTYLVPVLVKRDWGVGKTIKWAAMLTVLRPGFTILIFLQALAIFALVTLTGIGLAVLTLSLTAAFLSTTLRELLTELEGRWAPRKKPTSWKEIFAEQDRERQESRSLKDIFRPWDN